MILYLIVIFVCAFLIAGINLLCGVSSAILTTLLSILAVYAVDLVISAIVMVLPKKLYDPYRKNFKVSQRERAFLEKLKIIKWKDLNPIGKGPIGIGMRKDKVENKNDPAYLFKFLTESCKAEVMHLISAFLGFVSVFFFPLTALSITLPVCFVNFVLQLLPFLVQRHIRPKLLLVYERASKNQALDTSSKND